MSKLRVERVRRSLSQMQVALAVGGGLYPQHISNIEHRHRQVGEKLGSRIAAFFGLNYTDLFGADGLARISE